MFAKIFRRLLPSCGAAFLLALPLVGCAHMPAAGAPTLLASHPMAMPVGDRAAPPAALLSYCEREPGRCGVDASAPKARTVVAKAYWASVFAARPTTAETPQTDWAAVADQIRASPASIDRKAPDAGAPDAMSEDAFLNTYGGPGLIAAAQDQATPLQVRAPTTLLPWTGANRKLLARINGKVNHALIERSDAEAHGQQDYWTEVPLKGAVRYADCEDYVLTKRKALVDAGVPAKTLSIAIVQTTGGSTHAVLVVATDKGDFVLDNLDPFIRPWTDTTYYWVSRQSADDPFAWYRPAMQPEAARRLATLSAAGRSAAPMVGR